MQPNRTDKWDRLRDQSDRKQPRTQAAGAPAKPSAHTKAIRFFNPALAREKIEWTPATPPTPTTATAAVE